MNDVLRAEGIRKRFGKKPVLRDLDLDLVPGACTVLLGRNGAGKSTLLRLALGVVRPTAGRMTVAGADPARDPDEVRRRVGYVPDTPDAPRWMVLPELMAFARAHYPTWSTEVAEELAERFAVPRATRLGDMSRGESMKAMIVLALAHRPRLLLLDEPFAGLDPVVRDDVLRIVISALRDVRGLLAKERVGPLVDDRRVVVYRKHEPGIWRLDPETGQRSRLRAPALEGERIGHVMHPIGIGQPVFTPDGAPVVQLNVDGIGTCLAQVTGDTLLCTPCPTQGLLELVSCPDEQTVLAVIERRTLERLWFGRPNRDVLFPTDNAPELEHARQASRTATPR